MTHRRAFWTPFALLILLGSSLLIPLASAAPLFGGDAIEVPRQRAGDQYRYDITVDEHLTYTNEDAVQQFTLPLPPRSTLLVEIEGRTTARDNFGARHETVAYHILQGDGEGILLDETCQRLAQGSVSVRRDATVAPVDYRWEADRTGFLPEVDSTSFIKELSSLVRFDYEPCLGSHDFDDMHFSPGDVAWQWSPSLGAGLPRYLPFTASTSSVATNFHGRDAIAFTWSLTDIARTAGGADEGSFTITVADGLPAIARFEVDATVHTQDAVRVVRSSTELVGYLPGVGAEMPLKLNAQRPTAAPPHERVAFDALAPDTAAYNLPYRFEDAWADLVADPALGLDTWLDDHPTAILAAAIYERNMHTGLAGEDRGTARGDGGWYMHVSDATEARAFIVVREREAMTPAGPVALAQPVVTTREVTGQSPSTMPTALPADVASSRHFVGLLANEGFQPDAIESFVYFVGASNQGTYAIAFVSEIPYMFGVEGEDVGRVATISMPNGAVSDVRTSDRRVESHGVLADALADLDGRGLEASQGGALVGATGGLAVTSAVVGLAVLALLIKFAALPFYTRIVRDKVLDHPVRARLYEHTRSNAGITRAELIDLAGIGEGATRHHLDQLVRHAFLVELDLDGRARYYAAGEVPPQMAARAAVLRAPTMRRVYELYASSPELSLRQAAAALHLSAPSVHRAKKRLEKAGILPAASVAQPRLGKA